MDRAEVLQQVRRMRFEEIHARRRRKHLNACEAAEWLGVSKRTFRRWRGRYEADVPAAAGRLARPRSTGGRGR